jgi:hypothetical protein
VGAQKSLPKLVEPAPKMITETQHAAIDSIISFTEKDENEQAAIIKRFPAKSLKTMIKYLSVTAAFNLYHQRLKSSPLSENFFKSTVRSLWILITIFKNYFQILSQQIILIKSHLK